MSQEGAGDVHTTASTSGAVNKVLDRRLEPKDMASGEKVAISAATVRRSRFKYGRRVAALKSAVYAGDFAAVTAEKNAFILFNSGVFPGVKNKAKKAAAIAGTNAIFAAIRAKDKVALKNAFDSYTASNNIV
jgi:tRNA threonylcarbamoyladenosine modification (KEOPS) complex  Pcc1 subunit